MSSDRPSSYDDVSRIAYGKTRRLQLMRATRTIASPTICQKDLVDALSVAPAVIQQYFAEMLSLGMLRKVEPRTGDRRVHYEIVEGAGWQWAAELQKLVSDEGQEETLW